MTFMDILNSPLLYSLVIVAIGYVLLFSVLTVIRSYKRGVAIGMDKTKLKNAAISSILYSVVPSLSIIVGLFSLAAVIGVPWSWFRLSVVGSVMYELMAADMVATATGYESIAALSTAGDANVAGVVMFVMSICILGGIVGSIFFTKSIQSGLSKVRGKGGFGILATSLLTLAMLCTFVPVQIGKGLIYAAVLVTAAVITFLHGVLIKKFKWTWLSNFVMADALILGMASALFWTKIL